MGIVGRICRLREDFTMPTQTSVPLLDLKLQYASLREEIEPMLREVCDSQYFVLGPKVAQLEDEIAHYVGTKRAVGCASGSDALLLALMGLDVKAGDEVICPSYTFFATGGAIHRLGAIPIWADIDPITYNMTPESVKETAKKCSRLKAIMPVHLYGQTVDMDGMLEVSQSLGTPLIEDAAQAIGAKDTTGAMAGSRGTIGCFSFYPTKNLGGFGDGGMVTTNDDELADRMAKLRVHGGERRYYHSEVGVNSRLDALQAAVLLIKLQYLEAWHEGRTQNAAIYNEIFGAAGESDWFHRNPLHLQHDTFGTNLLFASKTVAVMLCENIYLKTVLGQTFTTQFHYTNKNALQISRATRFHTLNWQHLKRLHCRSSPN